MKKILAPLLAGACGLFCLGVNRAMADLEISASVAIHAQADFYEPLTPHGGWVEVGSYGRCWRPAHVAVDWRPYCDGTWVWTDCGWYWESDEPWSWACYHYGTWTLDPVHSWIWVPGIEWAPAWVSWRSGGGYCGWAPLAPRGIVIAAPAFVFVEERRLHERVRPRNVIVNNTTIINKTTVINNSVVRETRNVGGAAAPQRVVVNRGPGVEPVQKASGRQVKTVAITEAVRQTPVPQEVTRKAAQRRNQTAQPEPTRTEPGSAQPGRTEPGRTEPNRAEPNRTEPNRSEPNRVEPSAQPNRAQPNRPEPTRPDPTPESPRENKGRDRAPTPEQDRPDRPDRPQVPSKPAPSERSRPNREEETPRQSRPAPAPAPAPAQPRGVPPQQHQQRGHQQSQPRRGPQQAPAQQPHQGPQKEHKGQEF